MGGEEFKGHTISYRASKDLILVHTVQPKPMVNAHSSGKWSRVLSDVVIVHSEKTRLKNLLMMIKMMMMMMVIIMNKSQEMAVCSGHQKLNSTMELRPEK